MSLFDRVKAEIERGIQGRNMGLPMGFDRLNKVIAGIQRMRYDVVFAQENVGKTAFADCAYVLNPYDWYIKHRDDTPIAMEVFYKSLEVPSVDKLTKWIAWKIYRDTGKIYDTNYLLSKGGKHRLPQELYSLVLKYKAYFDRMEEIVHIDESPQNPTGIWKEMVKYADEHGHWDTDARGRRHYVPNDPNKINIIIIDTAGNLKLEKVGDFTNMKGTIDKMSEYCRLLRNMYYFTPVLIIHANRSIADTLRGKHSEIFPKKADIKDTNVPAQDANTVICLFDPSEFMNENNSLGKFMNYDFERLKHRGRVLGVLKNREGLNNVRIALNFCGEIGDYRELPPEEVMNGQDSHLYYEHAINYYHDEY